MEPFLPAATVVNAVVQSTKQYYDFLCNKKKGVAEYPAQNIQPDGNEPLLLGNILWETYHCQLPPHLSIHSDSPATLIPQQVPGNDLEIQILEYDRRTGQTKFAARQALPGGNGTIIIDFRWLVQRCLIWYQTHGPIIPEIADVKAYVPRVAVPNMEPSELSDEQVKSIRAMLTSPLSYIWGPPGTGKTRKVLAKAVHACVDQNCKTLVLASTNLAVDNALTAVLEEGVSQEKVARIGIPSRQFIERYPSICEERAFQHEIKQTQSQIASLQERIDSFEKAGEARIRIEQSKAQLQDESQRISVLLINLARIEKSIKDSSTELLRNEVEFSSYEAELESKRKELYALAYTKLLSDIGTLENEQTKTIAEITRLERERENIGFFARVFTTRKQALAVQISRVRLHIESVETTLENNRKRQIVLRPIFIALKSRVTELESLFNRTQEEVIDLRRRVSNLENSQQSCKAEIAEIQNHLRILESQVEVEEKNLLQLDNLWPRGDADALLAEWHDNIVQLEARLKQFRQDLSLKLVLGMTLDGFIGLSAQISLTVDHVFIDEAPYAPIAKVLPLLSLKCPISMLGDHRQLPPICESKNDLIIRAYWAKPAVCLEDAFRLGGDWDGFAKLEEPQWQLTQRCNLTASYRFGQSLASLLDRHIYGNIGLSGKAKGDTRVKCFSCIPYQRNGRLNRQNDAEVDAILENIEKWWPWAKKQPSLPTIAILTLYKPQANLIRKRLWRKFGNTETVDHVEVWNTHQAQGREWDWVLFSVSDTVNLAGNAPFWSDTNKKEAKPVLNTTLSRSKQHLCIFLDSNPWFFFMKPLG